MKLSGRAVSRVFVAQAAIQNLGHPGDWGFGLPSHEFHAALRDRLSAHGVKKHRPHCVDVRANIRGLLPEQLRGGVARVVESPRWRLADPRHIGKVEDLRGTPGDDHRGAEAQVDEACRMELCQGKRHLGED